MFCITEDQTRNALSIRSAAEIVMATYRGIAEGTVTASTPSLLQITSEPFRLGAKGAVLNHLGIAGVRLISRAAPRLMLWSLQSGEPLALIDESHAYRFRTGVSGAVCARYLLPTGSEPNVAIIGAGPIAFQLALAVSELVEPASIRVVASSVDSAERFAREAQEAGVNVVPQNSVADAVRDADLVITITSANEVLVRIEDLAPGAVVLSMGGGQEVDHKVWAACSQRFVDDLGYALHQGDAAAWIKAGLFDELSFAASLTGTVAALAADQVTAHLNDAGLSMAIVQGTTALDVALGHAIYLQVEGQQ